MNFDGNFKKLGEFDVSAIQKRIALIPEEVWLTNPERPEKFDVHADTRTIRLIFDYLAHKKPDAFQLYLELQDVVDPLLMQIAEYYDNSEGAKALGDDFKPGSFLRVLLVKLLPGRMIPKHRDHGDTLLRTHRLHKPIVTHENVMFSVGQKQLQMKEGHIWEINNRRKHSVKNGSDIERIHLIADYRIPGEQIMDNHKDPSKNALVC